MITGFARAIILYIVIIAGIRLMGKRQIGELEPAELVVSLVIADLASVPMQDLSLPLLSGLIPILTLLALSMVFSVLSMKSIRLRTLLCGSPSIVIQNGIPDQKEMARNRLTINELVEELRGQGYTDLSKIQYAILETNGNLSVLPYAQHRPPSAEQLGLAPQPAELPLVIISDGVLIRHNMKRLKLDKLWLQNQLQSRGFSSVRHIFLMTCNESRQIYLVPKQP